MGSQWDLSGPKTFISNPPISKSLGLPRAERSRGGAGPGLDDGLEAGTGGDENEYPPSRDLSRSFLLII